MPSHERTVSGRRKKPPDTGDDWRQAETADMTAFTLLLGGALAMTSRLTSQIAGTSVIAADSGIRHAEFLAITPALWIGDFDSSHDALDRKWRHVQKVTFPRDKDMTDGELAVNRALEEGASRLILCGAFGGERSDHTLLHMTMATALAARNIPCLLTSGHEEGWPLVPGDHRFDIPDGSLFSIIAFSPIGSLSINGAEWPLNGARLEFGSSLTLSNRICGTLAISLRSGRGMLVTRPQL